MIDKLKLYEINDKLRIALESINDLAEDNDGVIPDSWADLLDELNIAKGEKILDIGRFIKSLKAQAMGIKSEIDRLSKRHKSTNNTIDRLIDYISMNMNTDEQYKDDNTIVNFRKSTRVDILDPDSIPSNYWKVETTIMKALIKKDIKAGIEINGAIIKPSYTLSVK